MGHDWVFDVLRDLATFARQNGLLALAAKVEETKALAEAEIAARGALHPAHGTTPDPSRRH